MKVGFLTPAGKQDNTFNVVVNRLSKGIRSTQGVPDWELDTRYAEGDFTQLRANATSLIAAALPVIVADGASAVRLLQDENKKQEKNIPIVQVAGIDTRNAGWSPTNNVTGFYFQSAALSAERLEWLVSQFAPTRITLLLDGTSAVTLPVLNATAKAAKGNGIPLGVVIVTNPQELGNVAVADLGGSDGFVVSPGALFYNHRKAIVKLAKDARVKAVYPETEYTDEENGLMAYGHDNKATFEQAGGYVGRILKGTAPSDLPLAQAPLSNHVINGQALRELNLPFDPARAEKWGVKLFEPK